jgi:DNA replication protein DnaC
MFEKISNEDGECTRKEFESIMFNGVRYFDDLKTERIASNYGKVNIFKDILEERYNRNAKTHITCNFKDGFNGNLYIEHIFFNLIAHKSGLWTC